MVERLGRYQRTLLPGLAIVVPFVDRVGALIDLREQVVTFKPAGVITGDNVGIQIDGRGLRRGTSAAAVEAVRLRAVRSGHRNQ